MSSAVRCPSTRTACGRCARSRRPPIQRGDDTTYLVFGERSYGFRQLRRAGQRRRPRPGRPLRHRSRRPGGGAQPEQPRVVPHVLGHGGQRCRAGRAERLVEDRRDPVRPAGLGRHRARRRRQAVRAHRRPARRGPRPGPRVPDRRRARRLPDGRRRRASRSSASRTWAPSRPPSSPTRPSPRTTTPSSSTRRAPPGSRRAPSRPTGRCSPTCRTRCTARSRGRWPTRPGPACCRAAPADRVAADVAAVPRVGLPLEPGRGPAGRHQDRHPRGPVRARQGARADPGPRRQRVGHRADDGVAGVRVPGPPRLRHLVASRRWRSAARRRPTSCSARSAETFPNVRLDLERLRPDRDVVGRHRHQRRGRQAQAVVGRPAGARRRGPHRRPDRPAAAAGRDRRGVHPRARSS